MFRARFLAQTGHKTYQMAQKASDFFPSPSGRDAQLEKKAKIPTLDLANRSSAKALWKQGINFSALKPFEIPGLVTPSSNTIIGYKITKSIGQKFFPQAALQIRDFDGNLDLRPPLDFIDSYERDLAGGILTPRMTYNLIKAMPITQQQASLNGALLAYYDDNRNNYVAELANIMACDVGEKWGVLPARTPSLFGMNTLGSGQGLIHLFEDVPNSGANIFRRHLTRSSSRDDAREIAHMLGSACKLAEMAALGALDGSQLFMSEMQENLPLLRTNVPFLEGFRIAAARAFFTPDGLAGAISYRNDCIVDVSLNTLNQLGLAFSDEEFRSLFRDGENKAVGEGKKVFEIAKTFSPDLALENVEVGELD